MLPSSREMRRPIAEADRETLQKARVIFLCEASGILKEMISNNLSQSGERDFCCWIFERKRWEGTGDFGSEVFRGSSRSDEEEDTRHGVASREEDH